MYLEDKAEIWYQSLKMVRGKVSWSEFSEAVIKRFGEKGCIDEVEKFNKLQQLGSVLEYQERFEELRSLMICKDSKLSESYYISSFISGLKLTIRASASISIFWLNAAKSPLSES